MSDQIGASKVKENNHAILDNAVSDMESVVSHAEDLLSKITSNAPPSLRDGAPRTEPTLASVLSNAPQVIRDRNAELHDLLNKISDALF